MAALDKLLDLMAKSDAQALVLGVGRAPQYETARGIQQAATNVLDDAKLVALLKEIAGPDERRLLDQRADVDFSYRGFAVEVAFASAPHQARISLPGVKEQPVPGRPPAPPATVKAREGRPADVPHVHELLCRMVELGASDLHLSTDEPPRVRIHGAMEIVDGPPLSAERMVELLWEICPERNRTEWERDHDSDFAYEVKGIARFRCNYFMDRKGLGAVFRQIPTKVPTVEELSLPKPVMDLCWLSKGFVVVTGPTGSGKSTTLAALVNHINESRTDHIITIEDPIEFVHPNKKCVINQREVGTHTESFKRALRAGLREDPDIVLVGELRDLETIAIAIETSETGHLVFGTLHTSTAPSTVDRIIDQFPADRQNQIRVMLSETLKGVVAQTLCKKVGGGRVAAFEVLIVNSAISNLIREGKGFQIPSIMQTQKAQGNITLNDSLMELVTKGKVEPGEAYFRAVDKTGLKTRFDRENIRFEVEVGPR